MEWQLTGDTPIYSQLVEQIKLKIVSGALEPGERLPSVRDLALEAGVNPNTMQRALQELERDGLVFSVRTAGRFVTEEKTMIDQVRRDLANAQIEDFLACMSRLGFSREDILNLLSGRLKEVQPHVHS